MHDYETYWEINLYLQIVNKRTLDSGSEPTNTPRPGSDSAREEFKKPT